MLKFSEFFPAWGHGRGFLAAFVAGLVLGGTIRALPLKAFRFNEEAGELIGLVTWIAFGVAAVPYATHSDSGESAANAVTASVAS